MIVSKRSANEAPSCIVMPYFASSRENAMLRYERMVFSDAPARLMSSLITGDFFHSFSRFIIFSPSKRSFLPLEISLQRIYKQRLSESSRTTQIVVLLSPVDKVPNNLGLVDISIVVSSYFLERLYANR